LVIIDDSIVRGQKKKYYQNDGSFESKKLLWFHRHQIRYPDCYGIDMAKLEGLVAFRAALELLKERNLYHIVDEVYAK
jgi:amidophosphoribosyltransferase